MDISIVLFLASEELFHTKFHVVFVQAVGIGFTP